MCVIRLCNCAAAFDRVHKAQLRLGQRGAHQPHFRNGGNIEMRDSRIPQHLDKVGGWIGFDRIEHFARKFFDEETRVLLAAAALCIQLPSGLK